MNKNIEVKMYLSALKENEDYQWLFSMLSNNMTNSQEARKLITSLELENINYVQYHRFVKNLHRVRLVLEEKYFAEHQIKTSRFNYYQYSLTDMINMKEAIA